MENLFISDKNRQALPQLDTILIVDDEEIWCYVIKILLEDCRVGKHILTAKNGLEAIKQLQTIADNGEKQPDLIFLDIKMPVMDGFEFLEEATKRQELNLSHTRIFITTSSILLKDKERAKLYPVSGFITKPLTEEILLDILS